jgi:ABC-type multidrug transport system fused ATPase/permease subunit
MGHRSKEVRHLATMKYLDAGCVCSWALTTCLMAASTFALASWQGQQLTPAVVLVSLSLFNVLIGPLNALPWVLTGLVEADVSAGRLAEFLLPHISLAKQRHATSTSSATSAADATAANHDALGCRMAEHRQGVGALKGGHCGSEPFDLLSFGWEAVLEAQSRGLVPDASTAGTGADALAPQALAVQMTDASFSLCQAPCAASSTQDTQLRDISLCIPKVRFEAQTSLTYVAAALHAIKQQV